MDTTTSVILAAAVAGVGWYLYSNMAQPPVSAPGMPVYSSIPVPYSAYPSMNYAGTNAAPSAKALPPVQSNSYATAQAQAALQAQCAGSYPGCTPMMSDQSIALGL